MDNLGRLLAGELGLDRETAVQVASAIQPKPRRQDRGHAGSNRPAAPKARRRARRKMAKESRRRNRRG